jgi:hypothetical protein
MGAVCYWSPSAFATDEQNGHAGRGRPTFARALDRIVRRRRTFMRIDGSLEDPQGSIPALCSPLANGGSFPVAGVALLSVATRRTGPVVQGSAS